MSSAAVCPRYCDVSTSYGRSSAVSFARLATLATATVEPACAGDVRPIDIDARPSADADDERRGDREPAARCATPTRRACAP